MKAVRLEQVGSPLQLEEIADPIPRPGGVVVKIMCAPVLTFMKQVFSGELGYAMPTPFTPGANAVGRVESVAEDVFDLEPGQMVYVDPMIMSRNNGVASDALLIGLAGLTPLSGRLQAIWRDGTFAEKALLPAECLTPLDKVQSVEPNQLACLSYFVIPYGGLLRGEFRPGQTLIINGATGNLGAGAVLVALTMGAGKVVAVGRNQQVLDKLQQLDSRRVVQFVLQGNAAEDAEQLRLVAEGADLVLDLLGGAKTSDPTVSCIQALRPKGTAVLMGGVQASLPLPYPQIMMSEFTIRGAFMYPRQAPSELIEMVAAGTLDLSQLQIFSYRLDQIQEAIERASTVRGLEYVVAVP
ncbi:MAG: zinc-binding dehydrogenase [Chroococcidiopsidaceae cyanobacterium CP_BM_RX_35]|nr:zinc-binding dehydrogenase [Chroococcidiopsidaceae cyanobacterium CP_BM_RX_35]